MFYEERVPCYYCAMRKGVSFLLICVALCVAPAEPAAGSAPDSLRAPASFHMKHRFLRTLRFFFPGRWVR